MFTSIKEQMQNLNFTLTPSTVLIDFEIALRQSVHLQFPAASIKGCYFHFTQCLYRWIQTHGLAIDYRENTSNIKTFVSNCATLAFLPPANVRLVFASVSGAQDHTVPSVQQFATYFQQTWLRDFPIAMWNHCETTSERTNNRLEGGTTISTDLQADPIPTSTNWLTSSKKKMVHILWHYSRFKQVVWLSAKRRSGSATTSVSDVLKTVSAVDLSASVISFLQVVNRLDLKH